MITRPLARMVLEELGREVAGLLRTGHKVRLPAKPTGGGGGGGSNGARGRPRRPTADLAGIYAQVAYDIPCPVERYWGRR